MGESGETFGREAHWWVTAVLSLGVACATGSGSRSSEPRHAHHGRENSSSFSGATGERAPAEHDAKLSVEEIVPVVRAAIAQVKEVCWQPALDARPPDAPDGARLLASVMIDQSGQVVAVEMRDAPPGYPQLPVCVRDVIKTWRFPQARGTTTVNIPFVFVAQRPAHKQGPS